MAEAKNRFVFANASPYDTLDPHAVFDVGRVASRLNLHDGLMRRGGNPARLEPWLAEGYTVSGDGLTWTFTLRAATFHDGSPVEASDVVCAIERILAPKQGACSVHAGTIAPGSTKAADARTVVLTLSKPSAIFLATIPEIHVVNADLVKKNEKDGDRGAAWLSENDAGSGSFMLSRHDPAIGFQAKRFEGHFPGRGDKYPDEIGFRTVVEINSRVLGLLNGDFHGTDGYLPQDRAKRLRASVRIRIREQESMRIFHSIIPNGRKPFDDIDLLKAISSAFDYDGFITDILSGSVARNPVPLPDTIWGAPQGVQGCAHDLAKAAEYLAKVPKPWSVASARMRDGARMDDLPFLWRSTYHADPNNRVGEMQACDRIGARNNSWDCNPEVDRLLMEARVSTDQALRAGNQAKAATMVMEDAAGVFVCNTKWDGPCRSNVRGVRFSPIGDGQDMRRVHFE